MHKMELMNIIQKYWFPILMIGVLIYLLINSQNKINMYQQEIENHKLDIKDLEEQVVKDLRIINKLKSKDTIFIDRIERIKGETNEKIKLVDTMSVSSMQSFYTDRYSDN